jgi:hypothetical protein
MQTTCVFSFGWRDQAGHQRRWQRQRKREQAGRRLDMYSSHVGEPGEAVDATEANDSGIGAWGRQLPWVCKDVPAVSAQLMQVILHWGNGTRHPDVVFQGPQLS